MVAQAKAVTKSRTTSPKKAAAEPAKTDVSEPERQRKLTSEPPTGRPHFVGFESFNGETAAIYADGQGNQAVYLLDIASGEIYWAQNLKKAEEVSLPQPALNSSPQAEQRDVHPIARAYLSLSEVDQKKYWEANKHLSVEYAPGHLSACKLIGYQTTDAGPVAGIFADQSNNRHLMCLSFKTGAPFRLGQPRPPKRP